MTDLLVSNLPSITCFIGAIVLALKQVNGWGWLIFAGVLMSTHVTVA